VGKKTEEVKQLGTGDLRYYLVATIISI